MGTEYLERLQTVTGAMGVLGLRVSHLLHYNTLGTPVEHLHTIFHQRGAISQST